MTQAAGPTQADPRLTYRALAAAVMLLAGWGALRGLSAALNWTIDKPPMPLRQPLNTLPQQIDVYAATGDHLMEEATLEELGTREYLLRGFANPAKPQGLGSRFMVNLNYYPTGSSTPHVPDICWKGSGLEKHPTLGEREFLLKGVRHADGTVSDVKLRMLSFRPTGRDWATKPAHITDERDYLYNVGYTFNVNGVYVANRHEVASQFWKAENKYAYHAKIEIAVPTRCHPDQAQREIEAFMRVLLPEVEKCLPAPEAARPAPAQPR